MGKELLMDEATLERVISRIAHQILEKCTDPTNIGIIGMQTRGVHLSNQLADVMNEIVKSTVPKGVLDISFYRDDYRTKQMDVKSTDVPYDINGKTSYLSTMCSIPEEQFAQLSTQSWTLGALKAFALSSLSTEAIESSQYEQTLPAKKSPLQKIKK